MYFNEIDKFKIKTDLNNVEIFNNYKFYQTKHAQYKIKNGEIIITFSGKLTSTKDYLGGVTASNLNFTLQRLYEELKIKINEDVFLHRCEVLNADIKKDKHFSNEPTVYISSLREQLYPKTRKFELLVYKGQGTFENSIVIKPTILKGGMSFSVYTKLDELKAKKFKDLIYFNQFTPAFLAECANLIRFEVRLCAFDAMRRAFRINKRGALTPFEILYSNVDVVNEQFRKLIV